MKYALIGTFVVLSLTAVGASLPEILRAVGSDRSTGPAIECTLNGENVLRVESYTVATAVERDGFDCVVVER